MKKFSVTLSALCLAALLTDCEQAGEVMPFPPPGTMEMVSITPIPMAEVAVFSEDFQHDEGMWSWRLAQGSAGPGRALPFVTTDQGYIMPRSDTPHLNASTMDRIRLKLAGLRTASGDAPAELASVALRWARDVDTKADHWPFSDERLVLVGDPAEWDEPSLVVIQPKDHGLWNGQIQGLIMTISFRSTEAAQRFQGTVEKVELLQTRPVKNWRPSAKPLEFVR